jgi:hypothetical protein
MTSGPAYIGVIICILALLGFVLVKHPLRWGLLAASLLAIIMSWGRFFPGINVFLFENLPVYNKFRAPSMALVVPPGDIARYGSAGYSTIIFLKKRVAKILRPISKRFYIRSVAW